MERLGQVMQFEVNFPDIFEGRQRQGLGHGVLLCSYFYSRREVVTLTNGLIRPLANPIYRTEAF
jgi:hypothetical protein